MDYQSFLQSKKHTTDHFGFAPNYLPDIGFDFQNHIIDTAVRKGRMAIFADTGLGKTLIQLSIAYNIVQETNKRVLILTPLAVAFQFLKEAWMLGIDDIEHSKDGKFTKKIVICNYERLHYFNENDFVGVICDESSILKNFNGKIKTQITSFVKKIPYRFLSTATPAPNDYIEFGTSSEALGYLPYMDMLQRFFRNNENNIRPQEIGSRWYLKPHAKNDFFSWLLLWSVFVKKPSDLGFSDDRFILPTLTENIHEVENPANWVVNGQMRLFNSIARTMTEVRQEQQGSVEARCEKAVELSSDVCVYWCNFNDEGDLLDELDKDAVQVKGSMNLDKKEEILIAFSKGEIKKLITKPKITSFGLNWQHCNHTIYFPTWSYEQYYQAIRRFWRFGQKNEVAVDLIISDGQKRVIDTLLYKKKKADEFQQTIRQSYAKQLHIKKEIKQPIKTPVFL
ncbi:MAG: helicase [Porphyromonadaceae bacterium]|nr:helicase [Porphyromonadaceae bacterium]